MIRNSRGILIGFGIAASCVLAAVECAATDLPRLSGFAIAQGSTEDEGALAEDSISAQVQLGVDWNISPYLALHAHLLARTNHSDSERGHVGVPEAYFESNFFPGVSRVRLRGGAMFLPTSRENVDALWESPYTISSSALNTWLGEEFRPIGLDATLFDRGFMVGATAFRGNDTFGALPVERGWTLHNHWTLLGEWIPVGGDDYTSVSAENDGRTGWSARGGWNGERVSVQFTHIDNRSDGLPYGQLYNWGTKFDIASFEYTGDDWVLAGEHGWGPTFLVVRDRTFVTDISATYLLASKLTPAGRVSLRVDSFENQNGSEEALTVAYLRDAFDSWRAAVEVVATDDDTRVMLQLRYGFSGR
jgi:hypothetical protein